MSNTKQAKTKVAENGQGEEQAAAQAAQQAEAEDQPITVDFDGTDPRTGKPKTFTYRVLDGQPSPRAVTYIARYAVDREHLAFIPAMIEMLGADVWDAWCVRHESRQMMDFYRKLDEALAAGN